MISIPLILDEAHHCGYFTDREAQFAYVHPDIPLDNMLYKQLIANGFRRTGDHVYRPHCENCQQCIQCRLAVNEFKPSRQQRRTLNKNQDIQVSLQAAKFNLEHFQLYQRYQHSRHTGGQMAECTPEHYMQFLGSTWCHSQFIEFKVNQQIIAVAIVDMFDDALSAVYTFFDPELSTRSLGVYAVLWQIEYAKSLRLNWLYLGYWIKDCQKMSYKTHYKPLQGLINNQWQIIR